MGGINVLFIIVMLIILEVLEVRCFKLSVVKEKMVGNMIELKKFIKVRVNKVILLLMIMVKVMRIIEFKVLKVKYLLGVILFINILFKKWFIIALF